MIKSCGGPSKENSYSGPGRRFGTSSNGTSEWETEVRFAMHAVS